MTGQAAGLFLCVVFGVPALVLSWLGHREHRRYESDPQPTEPST